MAPPSRSAARSRQGPQHSQNVPLNECTRFVPSAAVTVTTTFENWTVIGGVQSGWNVAVSDCEKSALPFWTGMSPAAEKLCLFAAFGLF